MGAERQNHASFDLQQPFVMAGLAGEYWWTDSHDNMAQVVVSRCTSKFGLYRCIPDNTFRESPHYMFRAARLSGVCCKADLGADSEKLGGACQCSRVLTNSAGG